MTMTNDLVSFLLRLDAEVRERAQWGKVADYIPELSRIDPAQFGIAVALADGTELSAGDAQARFSIQSISKVFSLACVLGRIGDQIWERVGREPSGSRFDSILLLEQEQGRPRNPFINAGAIVTTDELLAGRMPRDALSEIIGFLRAAAEDDDIHIDKNVARSEAETGFRNRALANYLKSFGNLRNPVEYVLGTYFHQCAVEMSCVQLARAGRAIAGLPGGAGSHLAAPGEAAERADVVVRPLRSIRRFCVPRRPSGKIRRRRRYLADCTGPGLGGDLVTRSECLRQLANGVLRSGAACPSHGMVRVRLTAMALLESKVDDYGGSRVSAEENGAMLVSVGTCPQTDSGNLPQSVVH